MLSRTFHNGHNQEAPCTVSELNRRAKQLLEMQFNQVYLTGELSDLIIPRSGHWYFSLKDGHAQVRCVMFKNRNKLIRVLPQEGDQVIVRASVSIYENRGDYQLLVESVSSYGLGALQNNFEKMKEILQKEGLFDSSLKKSLPLFPRHIGIISSPTGDVFKDILSVLKRRMPSIRITLIASKVQGHEAAKELISAINKANKYNHFDVLILSRGGGSLEDLWPFNDEQLARTIVKSLVPIVSAVGHEADYTIADLVADQRAPTASAAAEMVSPSKDSLFNILRELYGQLKTKIEYQIAIKKLFLHQAENRLKHPKERIIHQYYKVGRLYARLNVLMTDQLNVKKNNTLMLLRRLHQTSLINQLDMKQLYLHQKRQFFIQKIQTILMEYRETLKQNSVKLNALSPLLTMTRGYAVIEKNNSIVNDTVSVIEGDSIHVKLRAREFVCTVNQVTLSIVEKNNKKND